MAYWTEWKSLISGGVGFLVLAGFMWLLSRRADAAGATGAGGLSILQVGVLLFAVGTGMMLLGVLLRP